MLLATVCNRKFFDRAVNLIGSWFAAEPDGKVLLSVFNGMNSRSLDILQRYYKDRLTLIAVERECAHAWNPRRYFFKTFTLHEAGRLNEPFLYADSAFCVFRKPVELWRRLTQHTRAFVQYPPLPEFQCKHWTTRACFAAMGCVAPNFMHAPQYLGGLQAYLPTEENKRHLEEYYQLMLLPTVAGPDNNARYPDGSCGCRGHRNDQSVISLLIEKRGWQQPFEPEFFMQYGDPKTLSYLGVERAVAGVNVQPVIGARQNRRDFVPDDLKKELYG